MDEIEKGTKEEHEHDAVFKKIASDSKAGKLKPLSEYTKMLAEEHVAKIKDYYTRLDKMEKEAKKNERKESEGLNDSDMDEAFGKWTSLGEKWGGPEVASESPSKDKEHFPTVYLKIPKGDKKFNVGEDIEIEFKACVVGVNKRDDGVRVEMELKEAKFE